MQTFKLSNLTLAISLLIGAQASTAAGEPVYGSFENINGINQPIEAIATTSPQLPSIDAEMTASNPVAVYGAFKQLPQGTVSPSQTGYGLLVHNPARSEAGLPVAGEAPSARFGTFVHIAGITFPAGPTERTVSGRTIEKAVALAAPSAERSR